MHAGLYAWPLRMGLASEIHVASVKNEQYNHIWFRLEVSVDAVWGPNVECVKQLHVVPREPLYSTPDLVVPVWSATRRQWTGICYLRTGLSNGFTSRVPDAGSFAKKLFAPQPVWERHLRRRLSLVEQLAFKADGSVKKHRARRREKHR